MLGAAVLLFPAHTLTLQAHEQLLALLRAAHLQGCHVYFEYPVVNLSQIEDQYVQICQELAAHCTQVRLWQDQHSVVICSTDSSISKLASHCDGLHALSSIAAKHCTSLLQAPIKVEALPKYMSPCYLPKRPAVCDGAGMFSTADHSANNTSTEPKPLAPLALSFKRYLASHGLIKHISSHLRESKDEPPLAEEHGIALASIVHSTLAPSTDLGRFLHISEGQPFRLNVLQSLAQTIQDRDAQLPIILDEGGPTGAFGPLPGSGQWPPAQESLDFSHDFSPASLEHCRGNWLAAENNPALLSKLVQEEIDKGFVKQFKGSESQARQRWPSGTAIGKLNIVMAEGRDPRLVLDSSVCGLNTAVHLPEHVSLPTASDVQRTFLSDDCYAQLFALSLDFKAAHKCCKVHPDDQGTLLFRVGDALHYYTVCHFGARFSAYWWQRTGSLILRCIMHALLCNHAHRAWLYVDDLLALLRTVDKDIGAALIVALLSALHAPISWKKAQFSQSVTWCGWLFRTDTETVELRLAKLHKLREQLTALRQHSKVQRKDLEAALGLLNWATSLSKHMRPFMAPLYKDLHSAKGTLHSIAPSMWSSFVDCLDSTAKLTRTPSGTWLPRHAQLLEVGNLKIKSKADVPLVPPSHKHQWVRLADPHRAEIHLRQESKFVLAWLGQCFAHEQPRSLRSAPRMHCYSAADAFADTHRMGIGAPQTASSGTVKFSLRLKYARNGRNC